MTPLPGRIYPKGVSGRQGYFTSQVALHRRYFYGLEATLIYGLEATSIYGLEATLIYGLKATLIYVPG